MEKSGNSLTHNTDCLNFVKWFADNVKADKSIDAIGFLGDWFECRAAINIFTLCYGKEAIKILDDLGLPIYFVVGNHDLHRRNTRDFYSVAVFDLLKNVHVIDTPTRVGDAMFAPFLFSKEYENLSEFEDCKWWARTF